MSLAEQERVRMRELADPGPHGWTDHEWSWYQDDVPTLLDELERAEEALRKIAEIAAREWAADETNYEWYGDIAGIAEAALGLPIGGAE